ncbi:hypothetical protein [Streptomyces sp. 1331.2]|uniref:hypothetical protein n=1 Tax=Streptomyces sp. 1331.2 TaxID=1938835 RepID=UPI000BD72FB8|nr:hypothetical protein [Streptomyces sp. 1331.2]SOB83181.1 hypothetical protein SAMN06272789_3381 [Streptomyces sp. 1331.2]
MITQPLTGSAPASTFSFVTMVENLVAGEHLEKNPWTQDAMWHNIANQVIDALVARGVLTRVQSDIITGATPLTALPGLIGSPDASPVWRAIYTTHCLTSGAAFRAAKAEIRNIMARRAVTTKQFSFMLGVVVDRDVRQAKSRREKGSHKPSSLQTARNAFGDGGYLTDAVAGAHWTPVYKAPAELLEMALAGNVAAKTTLMIGGGYALIMDGYLTRDRESKFYEGTTPYRGVPPVILSDLAGHQHGLRTLAMAWACWNPELPTHEYNIPDIKEDGTVIITGETVETLKPQRLNEGRLFEIANPGKAMAGFLKQQETRHARNRPERPEDRDRANRERLAFALEIAREAAAELQASTVSPPPHPFGSHDEWKKAKDAAHEAYITLVKNEPDTQAGFIDSDDPDSDEDDSY